MPKDIEMQEHALPTEDEIEEQAISRSGRLGVFRVTEIEDKKFWLMGGICFALRISIR